MGATIAIGSIGVSAFYEVSRKSTLTPVIIRYEEAKTTLSTLALERGRLDLNLPYQPTKIKEGLEQVFSIGSKQERLEHLIDVVELDIEEMESTEEDVIEYNESRDKAINSLNGISIGILIAVISGLIRVIGDYRIRRKEEEEYLKT